ncbi:putative diacylglycerol kinase (ATP) [Helianthus annuus]|nr:putative diacylglycerol kinase (ATP) [Helianthus annuus]
MDSSKPEPSMNKTSSKSSSVIDSIKGCTLSGMRVPKEELRRKITIPEYLRFAIRDAMASKDIEAGKHHYEEGGDTSTLVAPESPLVVFVNSKSGGRQGSELQSRLQEFMGDEQVFDLHNVKPHEFVQYGLACMESIAALGDCCAQETRERLRIIVAGGDGTVGWVLGCLGELHERGRDPVPPTAIIPLGTGNDLSRSFGWGGSFSIKWKKAIKRVLDRAINAPLARLDSWNLVISMPAGAQLDTPYALKQTEEVVLDKDLEIEGHLPKEVSCYQGVFYNYFSIGMDAQVAYGFHQLRNEKPYLAHGRIANKKGFVEANSDDGLLEIFGFKQGWHASLVMVDLISAKHIAQAAAIRFELRGGTWRECFMQVDGEPWKQPMNNEYSTFLDIKRVPFQSIMVKGENNHS